MWNPKKKKVTYQRMLTRQEGLRAKGCSANESLHLLPGEQFLLEKQKLQQFEVRSKKEGRRRQ